MARAAHYDLLAVDLDGTLLNRRGEISPANLDAIRDARRAGITVTICTGRGLAKCAGYLGQIAQADPVVVAGGSIVACPATRRTLHRFSIPHGVVTRAVERVLAHDHPALVLKDPVEAGFDYLVVRGEKKLRLDPVTEWWFETMKVRVRTADTIDEDAHPEHTVRFGACGMSGTMARIKQDLHESLGDDSAIHHFPAVVAPEHRSTTEDGQTLHVLEVFRREANKWSAVSWFAEGRSIRPERIAAIGDEINDLSMIRCAGLGIAMGNAVESVQAAAKRRTRSNEEDGVAFAIEKILSGAW